MNSNDFIMDIIAKLNKQLSRKSINGDLKTLDNTMYVKVIAQLSETLTKKALKQQIKKLTNLELQIGANVKADNGAKKKLQDNIKSLQKNLSDIEIGLRFSKSGKIDRNIDSLKKKIQEKPVSINLEFKKQKLVSDIEYLGKRYSKIFSNVAAGKKFENILNSAYSVFDQNQLANVRAEFQAFTSEIKAHGLAVQSTADKYKGLISKVKDLFSAATLLKVVFSQVRAAISETIDLDKVYTDLIKVNSELERGDYADYLSKCNQKAKELATTQKGLIEGATEFSKSGFDLSTSNKLSEKSTILANVGEMSDSDSAKAIISGVQAYDVIDGFTDVVDKADALISKYNEIGNTASITTAEIAKGVQSVGSVFADANTSVDEFMALLSAGNRQYQDADALALGLRTAALRIRGCSAELADMGEETDNVYTSASKLAEKIEGLTNINGTGGVKILEDDEETFRSIYDIFLDISKVYKDMSDTDASALLDLIAGKNRASAISATLNNMAEAQEILQNSLHSAGSAQKEYNTYLESTEAHIQRFKATLTETYTSFLDGNMVSHVVDIGTAVLDLNNKTDLLKHSILAIAALNIGKGVSVIGASIASTAKQMNVLGNALQQVKSLPIDKVMRKSAIDEIGESTKNLTEKNLKLLLSQKELRTTEKIAILEKHNLTQEEAKLKLEKMGLITATKAQSAANVTEATTTTTLKGAMLSLKASIVGVGASIKAAFLANPIGISLAAITTLASIATSAISKYNQQLEETRQKNIEAATTASENADKLRSLYTEYNRLASIQDKTTSDEEAFKTVIEDITVALGDKAKALENLTAGTDEYADALARVTKEELQSQAVTATIGRKSAEETFQDNIWSNFKGSKIGVNSNSKGKSLSDEAQKAVAIVSDSLKEFETINRTWNNISWDISSSDPEETLAFYNALVEAREKLVLASENDESLLDTEIYSDLNNAINAISENLDTYIEKRYQEEKLNYLAQNSIPETTEEYKTMEAALADAAGSSVDLQDRFKELLTSDFSSLSTGIGEVGDALRNAADTSESFSFPAYEETIDDIQSSLETLRSALDAFNSGTLDQSQVLDLMQKFPELTPYIDLAAEGFGNLSEGLSVLIAQQPASLIQKLQELKASLNTDAEREQVDLLINSLQSLSSYGDSGIEAYAATIGSAWNDTSNVIESVTNQFENLAKVQEAVADGLTISADAAAELASMYPEILTNAEYAGNRQITLNEEVVKSILAGDKSIVDAQITKLEADKAELEAKQEAAQAELNIIQQVGNGQGQISEEVAKKQISDIEQRLEAQINALNQENNAFAGTMQDMSANAEQFDNYAGNVSNDIATNMNTASASMANGMVANSEASQHSLSGLAHKATDVANAVAGIATGTVIANADAIYRGRGGTNSGGINTTKSPNSYSSTARDYIAGDISFDEFESQRQLDITEYQKAISNIDAQIAILKELQATFEQTAGSANGGIGGHDYKDRIKELEKEKDKINSALDDKKGSAKEKKDEYKELFDFFERRIKNLNDALSLLKTNLDNVTGSFAKNNLIDAQIAISEEKFKNYSDALSMYTEKANEALSKLPTDIAEKIKGGAVDLTTFIGDGNKDVVEAIKDYEQWADKVADCKQELAELKAAIRQLELEKFNNIVEDFKNQFDLREDGKDLISKQIALLKEAGELIGESFFNRQIEQSKKQLELLEAEKAKLVEQMESALASGRVQKGTDEWLSMVNTLSDVEGNILDCKKAIEEFDNELLQLHWDVFEKIQGQFKDLDSELSNLRELFKDFKVTDGNSDWSKEGIAQLGLLTQQYEVAQRQIQQYNDAINKLNDDYKSGKYSATKYMDKLADLNSGLWDAVKSSEAAKDAIMELNETRINEEISAIEKEIDAYRELIDAQIEALKASKDLHDYQQQIAQKTKSVTDLERKIIAMYGDDSAATVAKRKQLEAQLAEARKALEEAEYQHSIEEQESALNKEFENYESERNAEIEKLRASLEEKEQLIAASFETVKQNAATVGQEIAAVAAEHGIRISDAIITAWQNGENAIASYGTVLTENSSAFIGNLMGVENEVYNLQSQANVTAESLSYMFSTRADNLVNELVSSYQSEENLNNMTKALNDSLIKTLESGYNISSLTNAIGSIIDGVNGIASAARNATQALADMGAAQRDLNASGGSSGKGSSGKGSGSSGNGGGGDWHTNQYVRFAKGGIVKKDKDDPLNPIAESMGEDRMVAVKEGEGIFTKEQTELLKKMVLENGGEIGEDGRLYVSRKKSGTPVAGGMELSVEELKKSNPFWDTGMSYPAQMVEQPEMVPNKANNTPVMVNMDKMVHIDHVDSTNMNQVKNMISQAQDDFVNKLYNGIKYRRI